jgi:glycosyltransferase involved in cell wall biosynthesis
MRKLVVVTQKADPDDPVLGATVTKLRALAARVDELVVLASSSVPAALPENVRVHHFAAGAKLLRGARFEASLARELRPRPFALVAHMCPIYAVLAAPVVRPLRVPVVLWYVHYKVSPTLRLATHLATRIASVDRESFPIPTPKLAPIGHGIDIGAFPCAPARNGELRLLALGRYARVKRLDGVLEVLGRTGGSITMHGPSLTADDEAYRDELERRARELGVDARFGGPVPPAQVPDLLAAHDALVSNTRGGADKVVLEAAAACRPVLASSPAFAPLVEGLDLAFDGPAQLAERIERLGGLGADDRAALGRELRSRVERSHSVESWAEAIIRLAG